MLSRIKHWFFRSGQPRKYALAAALLVSVYLLASGSAADSVLSRMADEGSKSYTYSDLYSDPDDSFSVLSTWLNYGLFQEDEGPLQLTADGMPATSISRIAPEDRNRTVIRWRIYFRIGAALALALTLSMVPG